MTAPEITVITITRTRPQTIAARHGGGGARL